MSDARTRAKSADGDESRPLLSSDTSRTSLAGQFSHPDYGGSSAGIQYFVKGKYPTSLAVVADSEMPTAGSPVGPKSQSSLVTIFVLWNTMVGTSLLTMPWGVERAGLVMGVLLVIAMAGLCCYTSHCVVSTQSLYGPPGGEISELTRHLLGRKAELLSTFFSYVVLAGALIIYWILMSNFLYFTVDYVHTAVVDGIKMGVNGSEKCVDTQAIANKTILSERSLFNQIWNLELSVPIYLVLLVGPLLCFKSVTFFTKFNSLGILSLVYLMVFVLVKAWNWGIHLNLSDVTSTNYSDMFKSSFFATSGMLAMSYFMQNIAISIMRSNREQKNNGRDLAVAYFMAMITYLVVGTVFYISFPLKKSCIGDNMLNNFESWDVTTLVARVFLFFQLVTVFPLISFMLRYQVMTACFASPYPSRLHIFLFNSIIVLACVLFAIFLPKIGVIIRYTGALSGFFHVFTLPCVLRLAGQRQSGKLTVSSLVIHLGISLAGAVNLIAQFFVSDD